MPRIASMAVVDQTNNKQQPPQHGTVRSTVLAGIFAGGCGVLVGHPFDTLKVRLQVKQKRKAVELLSVKPSPTNITYVRSLYRGIWPPLATTGIMQSISFAIFENAKSHLSYRDLTSISSFFSGRKDVPYTVQSTASKKSNDWWLNDAECGYLKRVFLAGAVAGTSMTPITCPIIFVKLQQQAATKKNVLEVCKDIVRKRGIGAFYRGIGLCIILDGFGRGWYLWSYEVNKMLLSRLILNDSMDISVASRNIQSAYMSSTNNFSNNNDSNNVDSNSISRYTDWLIKIPSAWMAGVSSWLIVYPFDVIRSRLQLDNGVPVSTENHTSSTSTTNPVTNQNNTTNQQTKTVLKYRYKGAYDCIVQSVKEGGVKSLFRGLTYSIIRAGPVAATVLPLYEISKQAFEKIGL